MPQSTLSVLRPEVWPELSRRLEEAAPESSRAAAREVLVRPVQLLSLMAHDAAAALGEDPLAAERLRMLLYLAAPFAAVVDEARALGERARAGREVEAAYEPGTLDHGGLALLAMAALRVTPPGSNGSLARVVHGLALSAAAAEVLGRLVPRLPGANGLAVILDTLYLLETVGAALRTPLLRPFANDPAERGRWLTLSRLFEQHLPAAIAGALARASLDPKKPPPWDGARAGLLADPRLPVAPRANETVVLHGKLEALGPGPELPAGVRVVFASESRPPVAAKQARLKVSPGGKLELHAVAPRGVGAGWVGLSDDDLLHRSNAFREALRSVLPEQITSDGAVRGGGVPANLIAPIGSPDPSGPGKLLATPARTRTPCAAALDPPPTADTRAAAAEVADPTPRASELAAAVGRGPHIAGIRVHQRGRTAPLFLDQPVEVEVLLDVPLPPEAVWLSLDPAPADGEPLRPDAQQRSQRFHFVIDASDARDGMLLTAVVTPPKPLLPDVRSIGPLAVRRQRRLSLVLVRPSVLLPPAVEPGGGVVQPPPLRVDDARVNECLELASQELGIAFRPFELPWVDDKLAVLEGPLVSPDDARVPLLLEALSRRAMLTPNLEDALWVLLVPDRDQRPEPPVIGAARASSLHGQRLADGPIAGETLWRAAPAEAAHAVAVANPAGLLFLLADQLPFDTKPAPGSSPTRRLRLLGSLDDDRVELESVQEEVRSAGPGAPLDSGLSLVALDGSGHELSVTPLRCLRHAHSAQLCALLPISAEVAAVEVRHRQRRLARLDRTEGEGKLEAVALTAPPLEERQSLKWRFRHSRNAQPSLSLALGFERLDDKDESDALRTEVLRLDPCGGPPALHLTRYTRALDVQLFASDGWNLARGEVLAPDQTPASFSNETPVLIRRLTDDRYYADVPQGWEVAWSLEGGRHGGKELLFTVPQGASGTLRLVARQDAQGAPVTDERVVGP